MEKEELFKSRKSSTNSYNSKTKDECVNKLFDLKEQKIVTELVKQDPYLHPYEAIILNRLEKFEKSVKEIEVNEGSIENFARSYNNMGIHIQNDNSITFKEYAPSAKSISIVRF